jgi:hypothetical protein
MRFPKLIVVLVVAAVAGPALAEPPANVIDVAPRAAESTAVVVLRGSSAPAQPWGGPPAPQVPSAPQAPAPTYGDLAYAPVYFLPGYFQAPSRHAVRHVPPPPQVAPPYPIRPWGVGLAPFQR